MRQVLSRQVLGKGVLTAAAASSLLSIATGAAYAHPGAMAEASQSPGVLSGNSVSVPITFSPNVCGNSVDGGAALNPSMGNTCVTSTGSDAGRHDYERYLSPENAEAFERYLEERQGGRHALPAQRREDEGGYGERGDEGPRAHAPRHAAPRPEAPRPEAPRHAAPRHEDAYGGSGEEEHGPRGGKEECDDHPPAPHAEHPAPHPAPPAPAPHHPKPKPQPKPAPKPRPAPAPAPPAAEQPHTLPAPAPAPQAPPAEAPVPPQEHAETLPAPVEEQPHTLPAPAQEQPHTLPAPVEEQPHTLPAPAPAPEAQPAPAPPAQELPAPRPPHGSQPERPVPAPAPVPDVVPPADQPPAAPAGDLPVHLPPAPAPAPAPAPVTAPPVTLPAPAPAPAPAHAGPQLAATGAGELGAMAALASALVLGGAILYRRSAIA
ncbi:chaplin [Streptomyces sp. NPDC029721]|uniref:chaplin n=2 Tax=unclassified Streptomyces TaxID=2593676 RepID=UPI0033E02327